MRVLLVTGMALLCGATAQEQESKLKLKEGPGRELVVATCSGCHSVDYIQINAPFLDRKGWEAEVNKMVHVMGAVVEPQSVPPLVDYLVRFYGR